MRDIQLPDGTWVTSAISASLTEPKPQCPENTCTWKDFGPPMPNGILPTPIQLQRCGKCNWTRGRYLTNPHPDKPKVKIGGELIRESEICIIAVPPEFVDLSGREVVTLTPCVKCRQILYVDDDSTRLITRGAKVYCVRCALNTYPDMVSGRDPDTGRPLTLREIVNHPNKIGAYTQDDIKNS